jgi:hypothetical protein
MDESKETKKTRNITFRVTSEQYEQVESVRGNTKTLMKTIQGAPAPSARLQQHAR